MKRIRSRQAVPQYIKFHPQYTIYKMQWVFHKADADLWPSWLHAHSKGDNGKYKLDATDGKVYLVKNHLCVGKVSKTELETLKRDPRFKKFAIERFEYLQQEQSNRRQAFHHFIKKATSVQEMNTLSISLKVEMSCNIQILSGRPMRSKKPLI